MYDLDAKGAAMAIGALPSLGNGNEPRSLTQQWARAIYDEKPAGSAVTGTIALLTTAVNPWRCGIAMPTSRSCAITLAVARTSRSAIPVCSTGYR
jgi:hypothetical protein